ncbi:MAG: ClpXP protease specificity-enhancing factor SspB [Paracoccaceae bacterium]
MRQFSATLCFDDIDRAMLVPFDAVISIFDPSANCDINLAREFEESKSQQTS